MLLSNGPYSESDLNQLAPLADPTANYLQYEPMMNSGERIGRLPLIGIVWRFAAEVLEANQHLRAQDLLWGYSKVLKSLEGLVLGKHGTMLFMAAFHRYWFSGDESSPLTDVERQFL